ncbi:hypothetical protein Nepgr_031591 [Nepenthes gracilis]|uniref:Uncharacterized protein n=1 Tax=Nepenthes gracilis TaxID=150966 RepID=A0AAD3TH08_NEPGR|nr:hypothetical protein Nepgr_031591 [Nepenthes gracilis]
MNKLLEFGRKAMFYIRVLSGYEERRIRSYRLQLEQRLQSAQARKETIKKIPEQIILTEVRRMVEEMQNLNKSLEETEAAINKYFEPIDKEAEAIMNMQLEKDKARSEMMGAMYKQALFEKAEKQVAADLNKTKAEINQLNHDVSSATVHRSQIR